MRSLLVSLLGLCLALPAQAESLVVYSARIEPLIKPVFDRYTEETGVRIEFLTDKEAPLLARLQAEGERTPADILMTVDAGNLWQAAERGVLAPLDSKVLEANIPAHLRDAQGRWFALSLRARTILYNTDQVNPDTLSTYADLAEPRWKGKLCLRTSKKVYNQSLVAASIAERGVEATEKMLRGWVENLAAAPFASDDEVINAVASGRCAVGIVNSYYFGRQQRDNPDIQAALYWPDQAEGQHGVHVNASGAGVTRHAKNPEQAKRFLEWLSSGEAQSMFASLNMEFPANPAVAAAPEVKAWGDFRASDFPIADSGRLQAEAVALMDRVGYR
ncbi:extracellular solute-binding protein [Pseudomarimonas salicorniae]|uniref:Extracellular solute-binding protein n=1 Tax=Pseudomarimonas salicorniae TaxID=2933270 RepID=A0ABT0GHM0_9GAMM|nr:extracellular solute-binding protein [Lysobacter sp. CAU 1642]MCK7593837.1 extracellular solute-binding protein [Lysobacter sp. CAU 1642]